VHFFSKGLDPYERRRIGRALGTLVEDKEISQTDALDAAYYQEGPMWEQAADRSADARAAGTLSSFLFGVGFKARNLSDITIDRFYEDFYGLMGMKANMSPDEYRNAMDELRADYPFMDTVLLARKGGLERDIGYAYNVLGRIPPGQKDDIAGAAGIAPELLQKFWDEKGAIGKWAESDRMRFMAGIVDIGALLEIPDDATKAEWRDASQRYGNLDPTLKQYYGEDITLKIEQFFAANREDKEAGNAYMELHPEVGDALDWKTGTMINDPILSKYYLAIDKVEGYYNGIMYDTLAKELGADIWDKWDEYNNAKLEGSQAARAYWKAHPELLKYIELRDVFSKQVADEILMVVNMLPDQASPYLRDAQAASFGQEQLLGAIQNTPVTPYEFTWDDWQGELSTPLRNLVLDKIYADEEIPEGAQNQLEEIALQLGVDYDILLQLIENSIPQYGTQ